MGYRSEIYVKVSNSIEDEFWDLLGGHDLTEDNGFIKVKEDGEYSYYQGFWLKWYSGHKNIDAINNFINNNHKNAALLGIGEDGAESARAGEPEELNMFIVSNIDW